MSLDTADPFQPVLIFLKLTVLFMCVPILPSVWLPPETDFIDSDVAGAITRE